ncbi:MAG: Nif3-like dinuclear metal center hexameric protein [Christensenellales bacterium]|jgi:dinuclear metal center YbgI/SA1388 family protein
MACKVKDIARVIEDLAPLDTCVPGDNCGLLLGSMERQVKRAVLALDVNARVADFAISQGAQLIIAHHPVFFEPIMNLTADEPLGRIVEKIIKNGISLYCAHTNFDACKIGTSRALAMAAGAEMTVQQGFIAFADIKETTVEQLAQGLSKSISSPYVNIFGGGKVSKIAVCAGSGNDEMKAVIAGGADVYICGELKYHQLTEYIERGVSVITCGHRESELPALPGLKQYLQTHENLIQYTIEYFIADGMYTKELR